MIMSAAMNTKINQSSFPEAELIPIITLGKNLICPEMKQSSKEIDSGFGIADIVFYNLDKRTAENRRRFGIPRIKSYEVLETLSIINEFGTNKVNITQLYKKLPYSENIFQKKILDFLFENHIAEIVDGKYLDLKYKYQVSLKETTAIEAKVSNWKRGLYQAYRYKQYSDYSYLALHEKHITVPMKNIELFIKLNIGLISVNTMSGLVEIIYKPKKDENIFSKWVKYYANESILDDLGYLDNARNANSLASAI